jgi:cysteine-rich repeat protein
MTTRIRLFASSAIFLLATSCQQASNDPAETSSRASALSGSCGDGIIQPAVEQCDDGPSGSADCSSTCRLVKPIQTVLLFPFVTNRGGFDTGLAITNTSLGTSTTPTDGNCSMLPMSSDSTATGWRTGVIPAGQMFSTLASSNAPGFSGYLVALCDFQGAQGTAYVSDLGARNTSMIYLAQKLNLSVRPEVRSLLFPYLHNATSDLTQSTEISLVNTSLDGLGTPANDVQCDLFGGGSDVPAISVTLAPGQQQLLSIPSTLLSVTSGALTADCHAVGTHGNGQVFVAGYAQVDMPRASTGYLAQPAGSVAKGRSHLTFPGYPAAAGLRERVVVSSSTGAASGSCQFSDSTGSTTAALTNGTLAYSLPSGFQGPIDATCDFKAAGTAVITSPGNTISSYSADAPGGSSALLFPWATSEFGFDTAFALTNASEAAGSCTISYYLSTYSCDWSHGFPPKCGWTAMSMADSTVTVGAGQEQSWSLSHVVPSPFGAYEGYLIASCTFAQPRGVASVRVGYPWSGLLMDTAYDALGTPDW